MQFIILLCFVCLLVLQQTINAASFILPGQSSVNEAGRSHVARRLKAPLMGRSIRTTLDDETNLIENDPNYIGNNDENELINLSKRRYIVAFMNRRRLMRNPKKKGPLFG